MSLQLFQGKLIAHTVVCFQDSWPVSQPNILLIYMVTFHLIGIYTHDECHLDLRKITSFASARFIHAEVCGIDTEKKLIRFTDCSRPPVSYDVLSINIGITPKLELFNSGYFDTSEVNVTPVKPIDRFSCRWDNIVSRVLSTAKKFPQETPPFHIIMVGAGAGGIELCLAIYARMHKEMNKLDIDPSFLRFTVLNRGNHIMSNHNKLVCVCIVIDLISFSFIEM